MAKKKGSTSAKTKPSLARVAHAGEIPDIAKMIDDRDALSKALDTLVALLDSTTTHYDPQLREHVLEIDGATRVKAAQILIENRVGQPIKRQQILTGKMPEGPIDRSQLIESIDKKIAAMVNRPDVTLSELFSAKKSIVEAEKAEPMKKLSEAELVAEAKRIHGMADAPEPISPSTPQTESISNP